MFSSIFFQYLKPYKKLVFLAPFFMLTEVIVDLLQPLLIQRIIDNGLGTGNLSYVIKTGVLMAGLAMIGIIAGIATIYLSSKISQNFGGALREDTFRKVMGLSFRNLDHQSPSNLIIRLTNDVTQVQNLVLMCFRILVRAPLLLVGSFLMAFFTARSLSFIIIVLVIIIVVILFFIITKSSPLFVRSQKALDVLNTVLNENFTGIRAVKAFVREDYEINKFDHKNDSLYEANTKASLAVALIMPFLMLCVNFGIVASLYYGGHRVIAGNLEVGQIVAFINYLLQILVSLLISGMLLMNVTRAIVSARRILEIHDLDPDITYPLDEVVELQGTVTFDHVFFQYTEEDDYVLKDISFTAKKGETIGIIGLTGSGKSTLAQLIPRLYDATEGAVFIDGKNIKEYSEKTLRSQISIVLQKAILFAGKLNTNIRYGNQEASQKEVENAAKTAQAQEFIDRFPEKYDTFIYQKGSNLSGGQRQRVSIARGLVGNPKILILDDSTSALDAKSEALVKEALNQHHDDTTTFIIAQKISSIKTAEKILVIDQGKIISMGTHDELLKSSKLYQDIYSSQLGTVGKS